MSDPEPSSFGPAGQTAHTLYPTLSGGLSHPLITTFNRDELRDIFSIYGHKVAEGEWRDYAIDMMRDKAVFSIFRRTAERPLYRIEKQPKLARRQGAYSVVATTGLILKRGHDLKKVLRVLERGLSLVRV
jgi:hypothetical protein